MANIRFGSEAVIDFGQPHVRFAPKAVIALGSPIHHGLGKIADRLLPFGDALEVAHALTGLSL